jgi:Plasmid pRiA4b ORF-3-like protein
MIAHGLCHGHRPGSLAPMADVGEPSGPPAGPGLPEDMMRQFTAAISGMNSGELQGVLRELMAAAAPDQGLSARAAPPSRRRPRRPGVVTYRVRVDLEGARPPLWRRLELSSDLMLDEVHLVIQEAFGWTDSHLHQFGSGPDPYSPETELYLCPFQVDEGETGIPEEQVRLDEVLADAGDKLYYTYDFGDDWQHVIKLEAVSAGDTADARPDPVPRAVCTDGRRDGPAEDCGGVYAHELITAAIDTVNPGHTDAVAEFERTFGGEIDPGAIGTTPFDIGKINAALADAFPAAASPGAGHGGAASASGLPEPLGELVSAVRDSASRRELRRLLEAAHLDEPVLVDAGTAVKMVRSYSWLLDHVGAEGIKLTGAGYLPPAHVEAALAALGLGEEWIGKGNREVQTLPVLHLRESATKMGLLRKRRGMLLATSRGRRLRGDPDGLWWYLAERMPPRSADRCETQAGLLLLAVIAAGVSSDLDAVVARLLGAIGWISSDGTQLTGSAAAGAAWDTRTVLRRLGGFSSDRHGFGPGKPTPDGTVFARAALRTWPS